jgi:hypothetical protein
VLARSYFARQAAALLRFAKSTSNPELAAVLVQRAAAYQSEVDERASEAPDPSPHAPDVQGED